MDGVVKQSERLARIPVLSYGFRPFFIAGAAWAALAMLIWLGFLTGRIDIASSYGPVAWHAHELLFGYAGAIVAGFLLTAVPNWTGRLPIRGGSLLALFSLWGAGRVALLLVDRIGLVEAIAVDSVFLICFAFVVSREVLVGGDRRNAKVGGLVALLALMNILFHVEVLTFGAAVYALRGGIAVLVVLVIVIGGRIIPSFTRNWLVKQGRKRLPVPFNRFDLVVLGVSGIALAFWVAMPDGGPAGAFCILAGGLHVARLARWAGLAAWREPLVLILHVGYSFVPVGFLMVGGSVLWPLVFSLSAAIHAWTAGMVGVMTLAVMTRASLGHSGRDLRATPATNVIYAAVALAAVCRIAALSLGESYLYVLTASAAFWIAAFSGFCLLYGPMLFNLKQNSD